MRDNKPYFLDPAREQERLEKLDLNRAKKLADKKNKKEKKPKRSKRDKKSKEKQQAPPVKQLTRLEKRRLRFEKYREQKAINRRLGINNSSGNSAGTNADTAGSNPGPSGTQPRLNAPAKKKPQSVPVAPPPPPRWSHTEHTVRPSNNPNINNQNNHSNSHQYNNQPQIIVVPVN